MSSKRRVNKTFEESCRTGNLFIDPTDGTHWCVSKESPNSRKFDKNVCQLFACPNYISKEKESLSNKEKKIRGYLKKGKSIEYITKNTPCSRTWYYSVKKSLEEDEKRLEKEQIESDEESKAIQKIEPIEKPVKSTHTKEKPLSVSVEKTRVKARNRVYPKKNKLKKIKIKLMLDNDKSFKENVRHILDKYLYWDNYNIVEIKEFLSKADKRLNPLKYATLSDGRHLPDWWNTWKTVERIDPYNGRKYDVAVKVKPKPKHSYEWIKNLRKIVYLWEISHEVRGLLDKNLTTKQWYEKMELEFPISLEPEANQRIHNRADLERTGILGELEYEIKESLKIDDELEHAYYNWNELDSYEKKEIHFRLLTHKELKTHPYYVLLQENIKHDETENFR